MAEKWNDKLRKQLSDYTQAPPEGVWDAVEGHLARGRSAVAFPWWWALAGAAAAIVALLVVVRPSSDNQSPAVGPVVAEVVDSTTVSLPEADTVAITPATPAAPAIPAGNASPRSRSVSRSAVANAMDVVTDEAPPVVEDTTRQENNYIVEDDFNPSQEEPAEEEKAPEKPVHILPLKQYPAERPLLADASPNRPHISLVTSGTLGAVPSNTIAEYGMSGTMRMASSSRSMSPVSVLSRNKSTVTDIKHRLVYRLGLMANVPLGRRWSVETGVQFSRLASDVVSTSGSMTSSTHTDMHYFGVPLMAVYTPWSGRHLSVYLSAGPSVEYGFRSSGNIREVIGNLAPVVRNIDKYTPGDFIWSLGANVGAQWAFGNFGALFVQPGVSWHIAGENSPESYYTANPVAFNLSGGFRILF